ncbi:alpha-2-macroglobulin family protein [Klebsiella sp. RHBSTW-00484]|uniref:alpha-2-macroglobulin family protein n=1 Tax=unclassified Klebsiella TaxID=2608929 RepID=UPI0015E4B516|nr:MULTISPECIES: alpha-2-macroglobulin [unclassified Klebsiella]MBA7844015.1 alpha-2-macroglobulin family protein [Klebsiella sp. RHBSTW-00465]QLO39385.1 alpha-2-macroglobulin family protein [Klebsiella sp. RHBSTW-00484]QLT78907.1 alpha-2-macroglobulin family protein [Klebsiella sp. RHBSTW-00464]
MDVLRFLFRSPFALLRAIGWLISALLRLLGVIIAPLVGRISWRMPPWVPAIKRALRWAENGVDSHPKIVATVLVAVLATAGGGYYGWHWYLNRPQPIEPAPLIVQQANVRLREPKAPDINSAEPQTLVLSFSRSAAPVELSGKTISTGVTLAPAAPGEWKWQDDRTLVFTASKTLPMGEEFKLTLDAKQILAPQVSLARNEYRFTTEPFDLRITGTEFYQDPQTPLKKSAIFTVRFNAPVDAQSFEQRLSLSTMSSNRPLKFNVVYDEKKLQAWVHSAQLTLPDNNDRVALSVKKGVKSTLTANATAEEKMRSQDIPGLYSLSVNDVDSQLVEADGSDGMRTLIITTSDAVNEKALNKNVTAWVLPQHALDPKVRESEDEQSIYAWSLSDIDEEVLAHASLLPITMSDNDEENQAGFSFTYKDIPAGRLLLVKVAAGLRSVGGFRLRADDYHIVTVPDYPQALRFTSEGALLSMKGDKRITVAARNVPGLQMDIKRVIPSQLQHIVSFKSSDFTSTEFVNWRVNDEYFTERFHYQMPLKNDNTGALQYQGVDLGRYLTNNGQSRRGIFLLNLRRWDPQAEQKREEWAEEEERDYDEEQARVMDSRFVVVTDLGIMAKRSVDRSRDVFVQSIHDGTPVSGAKVSVVARNGTTLFSRTTEADGHVVFPSLDDFSAERTPVMFLVEKEGDVSFLPTDDNSDRQLSFSRFDVEGEYTPRDPRTLDSYLFSDRGVYRPGERFNIGLITRTTDWKTQVAGIPVQAEIRDPRDTLMATIPLTLDASGFSELNYTTSENSPTGDWTVYLYLLGKNEDDKRLLGDTTVRVKEFEPDRLKVALKLSPERQLGWVKPGDLKANIDVQNLFGTPAQGRRVTSNLTLRPVYPRFSQFNDYQFYENRRSNDDFETQLEERTTDDNGKADIALELNGYDDATYQLQLISEAFEAGGGRSVTAAARVMVSPHDWLVGVKADGDLDYINKDAERHLNLIAIDPLLKKMALPGLKVDLLEQKYLSVLTKQSSGVYKYQSKLKEVPVSSAPLVIDAQGSDFRLATDKPGTFVLEIKDGKDNVLNRVVYTVAGNANISRSLDRDAELKLTLNKGTYKPGEEIEVAVNAPYTGSGIITIERDKVYQWTWFHTDTTSSVQTIRVPEEMEGNGYINVQFIRDPNSDEIFMSPLSYGVKPFAISHEARQAQMTIDAPEVVKPGETLAIKVKTNSPQRVAVFAVDEGILQVARYRLKDPLDYFFRKRTLEVESWQILDLILPEFSKMMSLVSAPGGDGGEGLDLHLNPFKRKKDAPVAYWSGITDVDGEAVFNYPVPDYFNGKIRVMAMSVTPDKIGHAQRYTTVRDDFVLSPNVPTTVAPGDQFDVTLGVANNLNGLNGVKTPLTVSLHLPPQLEMVGEAQQSMLLAEKQEGVLTFRLKAKAMPGNATLVFKAESGNKSTQRMVSLSLRPAAAYRTQSVMGRMDGREQSVGEMRQMFDAFARRDAQVSWSPLVLTNGLAQYLADYPNACSEQIVSQATPLLFQYRHPEMKGAYSDEQIRTLLKQTLTTLLARQNNEGAIGVWRSSPQADPFITPYVVQFLLEAQQAQYPVDEALLKPANGYLKTLAANAGMTSLDDLRLRAFAAYLLTRQGIITTNLLAEVQTRLQNNYPNAWQTDLSALYLAASYQMLKMDKQAETLLQPIWKELSKAYDRSWWTRNYFDPLVQDSTRLYLITRHFPEKIDQIPPQLLENIVMRLKANRYTTLSSAMSILALEYYSAPQANAQGAQLSISAKTRDARQQVIASLNGVAARGRFSADTQEVLFSNTSDHPAWYVVTQAGYDQLVPQKAVARGLEISRDYTNEKGEVITQVTLGEKVWVHVKVRANAKQGVANIAIVDLLPGGFEVVQQTPQSAGAASDDDTQAEWRSPLAVGGSWQSDYSDIREDRVIMYGEATDKVQEFVYQIKATNSGIFTVPPAYGEAMYDREIQAQTAGGATLTVVAPPGAVKP